MPERLPRDEDARLSALAQYDILDTGPERPFERIVRLVQRILDVPMATVSFVDRDRQWFKARRGLTVCETERKHAVCDHTIRSVRPLVVPDLRADARFRDWPIVTGDPPILAYLGIPLMTPDGHALGALCAMDTVPRRFAASDIATLEQLAGLVVDWLEMRRISQFDFLTGAMTRRAFREVLERAIARHRRHTRPSALAVFDIDHFKRVNDTHGHATGDQVLKGIADVITASLREGDAFARLGGEEFALLLPETGPEEADAAAERFREMIEGLAFPQIPGLRATASFGVAALEPDIAEPEAWLATADRALYRAKEAGRNRCMAAA